MSGFGRRPKVRFCPASGWVTTVACVAPYGDHDERCPVCNGAVRCGHERPGVARIPEHRLMPSSTVREVRF